MRITSTFLGLILTVWSVTATTAMADKITVAPNDTYQGMEGSFQSGGKYVLYAGLHKIGEKAAVCGLIWYSDKASNTTKAYEKKQSRFVQYLVDGKPLNVTSGPFARYENEAAAKGAKAGCAVTNKAWSAIKDPRSFKLSFRSHTGFVD